MAFSVCVRTNFVSRRWKRKREKQAPEARKSLAQHAAAGGVLGKREMKLSPVGTAEVFTQTLQAVRNLPFHSLRRRRQKSRFLASLVMTIIEITTPAPERVGLGDGL